MSSNPQNNNTPNQYRTNMFNVVRKAPKYKPRFFTNRNLFYVRNMKKNNAKFYKKKMKLNQIKNIRNALARRELRNKKGLFITHQVKQCLNSSSNKNDSTPKKIIRFKKKIKFKFSVVDKSLDDSSPEVNKPSNNPHIFNDDNKQTTLLENNETFKMSVEEEQKNIYMNNNISTIQNQKIFHTNNNGKYIIGRWSQNEHKKFLEAIIKYGNDWKEIQKYIGTRSSSQARSHAQKFFIKLKQDQSKSKLSNVIDYSNSSIKAFHDTLQSLDGDKKQKIIKELENVVFDKQVSFTRRRRSNNKNHTISESMTEIGFCSGTDFLDDETIGLNELNDKNNKNNFMKRKMSLDSVEEGNRKIFEMNNNGGFTDEEYEKSFNKIFSDKENNELEIDSRKLSIEDDFIFNINA